MGRLGLVCIVSGVTAVAVLPSAGSAATEVGGMSPGRGTGAVHVSLARATSATNVVDAGEVRAHATVDPLRRGVPQSQAEGEVVIARSRGTGADLVFPDPPLRSHTVRGHHEGGIDSAAVVIPPNRIHPGSAPGAIERGEVAEGEVSPASVRTALDGGMAEVTSHTDIGRLTVLHGVTAVDGAGLGDQRAWSGSDDAGADARSFHVRSATLLGMGAVLDLLGVEAGSLTDDLTGLLGTALGGPGAAPGATPMDLPLLAVSDVSATAHAVAAVGPDGTPHAAVAARGTVGSVFVGSVQLEGFSTDATSEEWDDLEDKIHHQLDKVLGALGDRYRGSVRVRILPRLSLTASTDGEYVSAEARMALLALQVTLPPPLEDAGDTLGPVPVDLESIPQPVDSGGGALDGVGLPRSDVEAPSLRMDFATLEVDAEHTRQGVAVDCSSMCAGDAGGSSRVVVNRPWSAESGLGAPGREADLPRTGAALATVPLAAAAAVALGALGRRSLAPTAERVRTQPIPDPANRRERW